jgi:predicted RNA binding protein YcfA (HicA-like mRNA interferase family)
MSQWSSKPARRVLSALLRIGWTAKRQSGSHRTLAREGFPDFVFAFHDKEENWTQDACPDREADRVGAGGSLKQGPANTPLQRTNGAGIINK